MTAWSNLSVLISAHVFNLKLAPRGAYVTTLGRLLHRITVLLYDEELSSIHDLMQNALTNKWIHPVLFLSCRLVSKRECRISEFAVVYASFSCCINHASCSTKTILYNPLLHRLRSYRIRYNFDRLTANRVCLLLWYTWQDTVVFRMNSMVFDEYCLGDDFNCLW